MVPQVQKLLMCVTVYTVLQSLDYTRNPLADTVVIDDVLTLFALVESISFGSTTTKVMYAVVCWVTVDVVNDVSTGVFTVKHKEYKPVD